MFKNIIEFFKKTQEIRDQRFQDFENFHLECVQEFPRSLRDSLKKEGIHPALRENKEDHFENWVMAFDAKDILWWREAYKAHNFMCKPVDDIKKETLRAAVDAIDRMPLEETDQDIRKLYDSILEELIKNDRT